MKFSLNQLHRLLSKSCDLTAALAASFSDMKCILIMAVVTVLSGSVYGDDTQPVGVATNSLSATSVEDTNGISINSMDALDNKYKLAVGDRISFRVVEDEDRPKTLVIMDSGDAEIPYIGHFPAAGKTCKQLAEQLKVELEKRYYYRATVIITVDTKITHGIIYLVGAVNRPGPLEMPRDDVLTVSKAILRAGGFTEFADEKHVRVTRKGDGGAETGIFTVNVAEILDDGKIEKDRVVEPGDLIYVPERVFRF